MVTEIQNNTSSTREQNWRLSGLNRAGHRSFQVSSELCHRVCKHHARGPLGITHYNDEPLKVEEVDTLLEQLNRGSNKVNMGLVLEQLLRHYSDKLGALTHSKNSVFIDKAKSEAGPLRGAIEVVSQYVDQRTLNRLAARDVRHAVIIGEIVGHVTPDPEVRLQKELARYGITRNPLS